MDPIFAAAIDHIRLMETRIEDQRAAIEHLRFEGRDISHATRRLKLLHSALGEMRTQLAQLTPTKKQVSAPAWALPLIMAPAVDHTSGDVAA